MDVFSFQVLITAIADAADTPLAGSGTGMGEIGPQGTKGSAISFSCKR